jgi:hypothetical protein
LPWYTVQLHLHEGESRGERDGVLERHRLPPSLYPHGQGRRRPPAFGEVRNVAGQRTSGVWPGESRNWWRVGSHGSNAVRSTNGISNAPGPAGVLEDVRARGVGGLDEAWTESSGGRSTLRRRSLQHQTASQRPAAINTGRTAPALLSPKRPAARRARQRGRVGADALSRGLPVTRLPQRRPNRPTLYCFYL